MAIDKNFVVKHGLEVNTDLILANATTNQVGIATTVTKYTLHVNGGIGATNLSVTGVATFPQLILTGSVSAASTTGTSGQYLKSTGTGVVWENFPVGRTSTTFVASAGQDTFSFAYSVGLIDVFVNGIKLTPSEFNASDGVSIVLNTTCFGGEVVDVHAYSVSGIGVGGTGITGLTVQDEGSTIGTPQGVTSINFIGAGLTASASGAGLTVSLQDAWTPTSAGISTLSNVGVGTTNPRFSLEVGSVGYADTALWVNGNARITGILTVGTSSIVLDGSTDTLTVPNLIVTNSASGSSIVIRDNGSISGSASAIDFGDNLSVTFSSGIATITGSAGGQTSSQWTTTAAGIHTLSSVGIGTTNPTSKLTVKGNTSLETLNVSGISTFTIGGSGNTEAVYFQSKTQPQASLKISQAVGNDDGVLMTFSSSDGDTATIETDSNSNLIISTQNTLNLRANSNIPILQSSGQSASLFYSGDTKFETLGAGVTVTGTTFTNQLSVSGIATIGPVATGTTSLYLGGPLKVGEIDISGGSSSVHVGQGAGRKNYNGGSGQQNTAVGYNALGVNQASNFNTAFGISALGSLGDTAFSNYDANTAIGAYAGSSLLTGINNTFLGRSAGSSITSGSSNTILGMYDGNSGGLDIRTSSNNVVLSDGAGNIRLIANAAGNIGLGTTNPTSKLTVKGNTSLETLSVSGVSTFSGNISVAGTVTADTMVFTNDGGSSLNGSLTINNVSASYTELFFRDSSGSVQSNIQGGTNLSLNPGGSGYISLGTYSLFYPNGDVTLNNGNQGTTLIRNQVHVQSGITSFYGNVSVGGTITVNTGDISVGVSTANGVILTSPNGTRYRLIVDNSGNLSTTAV